MIGAKILPINSIRPSKIRKLDDESHNLKNTTKIFSVCKRHAIKNLNTIMHEGYKKLYGFTQKQIDTLKIEPFHFEKALQIRKNKYEI